LPNFTKIIHLFTPKELHRYSRHLLLAEVGNEGQSLLKNASVLLVGAGGLGCPVLQYLVAAGVGTIGVCDGDVVDETNLQRQVLYGAQDVGKLKVEVAKHKLSLQNEFITITAYPTHLNVNNALEIISNYDIIVDCTDNFSSRYLINDACVIAGKPFVYGAIYKFSGQVSVLNFKGGPTYRCLFPSMPDEGEIPNCSEIGVLGVLPGLIGTMQANEVLKMILGLETLSGELLSIDALSMQQDVFSFELNPENLKISSLKQENTNCEMVPEITAEELLTLMDDDIQLVDVREQKEYDSYNIGGVLAPLSNFEEHIEKVDESKKTIVVCQSGNRSLKAAATLLEKGFNDVVSLKGGLISWKATKMVSE